MARPIKQGLDYFPFSVLDSLELRLIEAEFGLQGYAIYVKFLQQIYGNNGYYAPIDKDILLLFSRQVNVDVKEVSFIVKALIKRGIFNRKMYDKYSILTSEDIQLTYLEAKKRGNAKINVAFSLIKDTQMSINVTETPINVTETPVNVAISTQSKIKKNKGNIYTHSQNKNKFINYDQPSYTKEELEQAIQRKELRNEGST